MYETELIKRLTDKLTLAKETTYIDKDIIFLAKDVFGYINEFDTIHDTNIYTAMYNILVKANEQETTFITPDVPMLKYYTITNNKHNTKLNGPGPYLELEDRLLKSQSHIVRMAAITRLQSMLDVAIWNIV